MRAHVASLPKLAGAVGISLALALGASSAFADDDGPTAYLYEGSCANLESATMLDEINELESEDLTQTWALLGNGQDMPDGMLAGDDDVSRIDNVQTLVDGEYAIVVHEREDANSAVFACGDISGTVQDDSLTMELDEVDGSGWEGRAFIYPEQDRDDRSVDIEVVLGIYPTGSVEPLPAGTPATPAS